MKKYYQFALIYGRKKETSIEILISQNKLFSF